MNNSYHHIHMQCRFTVQEQLMQVLERTCIHHSRGNFRQRLLIFNFHQLILDPL